MKAIPIPKEQTGDVGCMSFNSNAEALHYWLRELSQDRDIVIIDPKGMTLSENPTIFGTLGKHSKMITFVKEDFRPELAPERAKITEFQVDGKEFVRMMY